MAGNSFGQLFKITSFGESHGVCVGVVVDGCPAGLELSREEIQVELDRRRPGQSEVTTPRDEADSVEIMSGVFEGVTTGMPIMLLVKNKDQRSRDYSKMKDLFRPSHADYVYQEKYGLRDYRGGGRSSARETVARVAAGVVAKKLLTSRIENYQCLAFVQEVADLKMNDDIEVNRELVEGNIVRCPDAEVAEKMIEKIKAVKADGDTLGGVVKCVVSGLPVGLGDPVFDKLHADLGKAMLSINAVKGFEIGSGFAAIKMKGSEHNDAFYKDGDDVRTKTNFSGGVQGGISNGEEVYFRVAFKPVATVMKDQDTVGVDGEDAVIRSVGRHDPCVVPRAVPIVEAMANLVLADHYLRFKAN